MASSTKTNLAETGKHAVVSRPAIARDEMNLAEFPLTVLSTRVNTEVKTLEFKDTIRGKSGELIEREWIITGADKFGLPTATDDDVILGLMCLTMDQGFRERKVYFSRYELLKILRWTTEGRSYSRLSKSLDRLSGVRIRSSNAFFDNSQKGFQTCNFGIIDAYEIKDTRGSKDKSFFIWSEMMFDSFRSGFIKKIDLDFYFSLKSSVSRRLYRYLDKHFYYRSVIEKPLLTLAFEKLGLSRSYQYVSSIKQQIEPAAQELIDRGYLESFSYQGRGALTLAQFVSASRSENFRPKEALTQEKALFPELVDTPLIDSIAPENNLKKEAVKRKLQQNGLTLFQANKLLNQKTDEELLEVEKTISNYESIGKEKFSNPVGFLYRAVEDSSRFQLAAQDKPKTAFLGTKTRPDRKLVNAAVDSSFDGLKKQEQDKIGLARKTFEAMPKAEKNRLREETSKKLAVLQSILEADKFEEALQGCILEEIKRKL